VVNITSNEVTSLHKSDGAEPISEFFKIGNRFHVAVRKLSPEILYLLIDSTFSYLWRLVT